MADAKCKGRESVCAEIGTFLFIPRYMVDVDRFVVRNTLGHDHRSLKTEAFVAARTFGVVAKQIHFRYIIVCKWLIHCFYHIQLLYQTNLIQI